MQYDDELLGMPIPNSMVFCLLILLSGTLLSPDFSFKQTRVSCISHSLFGNISTCTLPSFFVGHPIRADAGYPTITHCYTRWFSIWVALVVHTPTEWGIASTPGTRADSSSSYIISHHFVILSSASFFFIFYFFFNMGLTHIHLLASAPSNLVVFVLCSIAF